MNTNDYEGIGSVIAGQVPRAGRREWVGLAVLALPCLLYSMNLTVLNLAVLASAVNAGIAVGTLVGGWAVASFGASAPVMVGAVICAIVLPATWATRFLKVPAVGEAEQW